MTAIWTPERDQQLRSLVASDHSISEAAGFIGVSRSAAIVRARKLGLKSTWAARKSAEWCGGRAEDLRTRVGRGETFAAIARDMGLTKNAAIGKAYRMGLTQPKPRPKRSEIVFPDSGHCVWPIGHPGEEGFHFCGAKVALLGASYCREHLLRAHEKRSGSDRKFIFALPGVVLGAKGA